RQLTHEVRAEAKFTLIMPCKKEENGTLSLAQRLLADFALARRRKSLQRRIKAENGKLLFFVWSGEELL
ncbi:MAG: hypothetical protein IKL20_05170, partial [Alistipes sp.]|nr:hypothetical protein [Alistipes sp.]